MNDSVSKLCISRSMLWCLFCSRACWAEPCVRSHLDPSNLQRWHSTRWTLHPASASYTPRCLLRATTCVRTHLAPWFQYRTLQRTVESARCIALRYRALVFDTLRAHAKKPSYTALSACLKGCLSHPSVGVCPVNTCPGNLEFWSNLW